MARLQIKIQDIKDVYESGKVIFYLLDGPKEFILKTEEISKIKAYFRGEYELLKYNGDLLLSHDSEEKMYFIKIIFGKVYCAHPVSFIDGVLLEHAGKSKIFQERRD